MTNTLDYAQVLLEVKTKVSELDKLLSDQYCDGFNPILEKYSRLFNRFCPYKVGDRVQLKNTPDIHEGSGWQGSKQFLVKGAIATVQSCDYCKGLFVFQLVFDNESWIDMHGQIHQSDTKHTYLFSENWIEEVD